MRSLRHVALLAFAFSASTAHADSPRADGEKANVSVAQNQIDSAAVEALLAKVADVRDSAGGRGEFTMEEILSFLPLTADERANVVNAHSAMVPITCAGDICTGVSQGAEVYQNLSQLNNIPAYFARTVTLKLRWHGPKTLEICSIKGFQVKQIFWVNVDGAVIVAGGAEGSSFVDVSVGGSFPDC